ALLPVIVELGRVLVPAHEDVPEHPGPIVTEPKVVHLLVERSYSKDGELRRGAFTTLADLVPAASLAPYPDTLHTVVQEYPATDGALLLLGKSSKPAEALALLQSTPALASSSSDDAIMVRARLGEQVAEDSLLQAYRDADDAKQREAVAWRLGYAGTDRLVDLLADEIRSPETYVWNMGLRRSLRVHVIEGLHQAFPTEPIFWKSGTGWTCRMHIRSRRFDGLWAGQVGRGGPGARPHDLACADGRGCHRVLRGCSTEKRAKGHLPRRLMPRCSALGVSRYAFGLAPCLRRR